METENQQAKMQQGTWDTITTETPEQFPKIKFDIKKPVRVIMKCNKPREITWETGVFYVFDALENNEKKAIVTSSWSLLRGLKTQEPLLDKELQITKQMTKGKQFFTVELIKIEEVKV